MEKFITSDYPAELRSNVFAWASEYSKLNHARMISIVSLLQKEQLTKEDEKKIFQIGCDIHKQGGKTAQQACYYVARNFISRRDPVLTLEINNILCLWDGAGDWKY